MTVTLYAKPNCAQCDATCRSLEKHHLVYEKVDVTTNDAAREQLLTMGYLSAPVVVAGEQHWSGFRPDRIGALVI